MPKKLVLLDQYLQELSYKGLSVNTINPRRYLLTAFCQGVKKPLAQVTRDDVLKWIEEKEVAPSAQRNYRYWTRDFLRFAGYPVEIPRLKVREKLISRKDLVTPEEVHQMLIALEHPRDRALLHVLYETGTRASELLGITMQDIEFGEILTKIRVEGKTGTRVVPIIESAPNLQVWINYCRPLKPDERIWQGQRGPISYSRLLMIIQDVSQRVLGRTITPHRLRHSCVTELRKSTHFTDAMLCQRFGWKRASSIIERYSHLTDGDVEAATLQHHGITQTKTKKQSPLRPKTCPRCQFTNSAGSRFCSQCSLTLDRQEAQRIVERDQDLLEFMDWLVNNPEKVKALRDEMRKTHKSGT